MSASPRACPECLRHSWLLNLLAPYIERRISSGADLSTFIAAASAEELAAAAAPDVTDQVLARVAALSEAKLRGELDAAECWATCRHDESYPSGLREVATAPVSLIGRGEAARLKALAPVSTAAVVGARRATAYGREVARTLGRDLADAALTVVGGLAFGVEGCAHRGALEAGSTLAVLACGPDVAYPASHRSLWRRICEEGVVISELPPGAIPWRWTFPARTRIMAALAGMTVVVEAATGSGSLSTADFAAEYGRDVGAVPGPVTSRASAGPNHLLAGGACVVREAQDVLDAMLGREAVAMERDERAGGVKGAGGGQPARATARCDDCGRVWALDELAEPERLGERLDPGGRVPAGECPSCGALAYEEVAAVEG